MKRLVSISFATTVLLFAAGVAGCGYVLDESFEAKVGDCIIPSAKEGNIKKIEHVSCNDPQAYFVTNLFDITGYDDFPGYTVVEEIAYRKCPFHTDFFITPTEISWKEVGDREVMCLAR